MTLPTCRSGGFLEVSNHNVLISQDQRILKILDIKEARRISEWFQSFWGGTQGRGPGSHYTAHRGLVVIMFSLLINLGPGSPGTEVPGFPVLRFQGFPERDWNHNVLPPLEGDEIILRASNQKTDLIIRSCLRI